MADLTIDELAARTGTKSSTIRMYQNQGLLPPPKIRGRVGFYGEGHLARLDLIARLQERGYTLAAIKELAESWSAVAIGAVLGLERAVTGGLGDQSIRLTFAELARAFPDAELDASVMQHAAQLGLVTLEPDGVRVAEPRFLDIGSELVARGLTPGEVLDEWERVDAAATMLAEQFRGDVRAPRVAAVRRRRHARGPARRRHADARAHAGTRHRDRRHCLAAGARLRDGTGGRGGRRNRPVAGTFPVSGPHVIVTHAD